MICQVFLSGYLYGKSILWNLITLKNRLMILLMPVKIWIELPIMPMFIMKFINNMVRKFIVIIEIKVQLGILSTISTQLQIQFTFSILLQITLRFPNKNSNIVCTQAHFAQYANTEIRLRFHEGFQPNYFIKEFLWCFYLSLKKHLSSNCIPGTNWSGIYPHRIHSLEYETEECLKIQGQRLRMGFIMI